MDTQSGESRFIHSEKNNKETGTLQVHTAESEGELIPVKSISGRGNDSWVSYDKKPYNIELALEEDLLGLGQASEWILLANASDGSHLRNKLAFDLADALGLQYTPDSQWVDLYLNGEYTGLYLLCERIEIHPERVSTGNEDIFLFSLEMENRMEAGKDLYIKTANEQIVNIRYPEVPDLSEIEKKVQTLENAILSDNGIDPVSGKSYLELIDLDSWVKKYLMDEVLGNLDGAFISQYFYLGDDGKIYAGPVWDYDLSAGNDTCWQLQYTNGIFADRLEVKENISSPWFHALCQKPEFHKRMLEIYEESFKPELQKLLYEGVDLYVAELAQAAHMNNIRWDEPNSMEYEVEYLRSYLQARMQFLDSYLLEKDKYCLVCIDDGRDSNYSYVAVLKGQALRVLPQLPERADQKFVGWFYSESDKEFDSTAPVYDNIKIHAQWEKTDTAKIQTAVKYSTILIIAVLFVLLLNKDIRLYKKVQRKNDAD